MSPVHRVSNNGFAVGAGTSEAGAEAGRTSDDVLVQKQILEERERLTEERLSEVAAVRETHLGLVHERFHLDKWVSLLSYDPEIAKMDNSPVFQEYSAKFDLLEQSAPAGPSRSTRRAHTERRELFKGSSASVSAPPRAIHANRAQSDRDANVMWNILSVAKSKGKGKAKDVHIETTDASPSRGRDAKPKAKSLGDLISFTNTRGGPDTKLHEQLASPSRSHIDKHAAHAQHAPRKRRKLESNGRYHDSSADTFSTRSLGIPIAASDGSDSISAHVVKRTSERLRKTEVVSPATSDLPPSSPSKFLARRVKLIVRRPPPALSNPRQKPPPPRFGESVTSFLSSYTNIDGQDLEVSTLEEMARKDAAFWNRVDALRSQGLLRPANSSSSGTMDLLGSRASSSVCRRSPDIWDSVIEAVKNRASVRPVTGRHIASQIASRVQAYWDNQAARQDKVKAQEEKRLRALAKATIRMVTAEWKKAVFHIREQERLGAEAEERKRGHEHLNAILDQSGQILEAQHVDLSKMDLPRSRSRSSSVSATLLHWASPSPAGDDESSSSDGEESQFDGSTDTESLPGYELDSSFLLRQDSIASDDNPVSQRGDDDGTASPPSTPMDIPDNSKLMSLQDVADDTPSGTSASRPASVDLEGSVKFGDINLQPLSSRSRSMSHSSVQEDGSSRSQTPELSDLLLIESSSPVKDNGPNHSIDMGIALVEHMTHDRSSSPLVPSSVDAQLVEELVGEEMTSPKRIIEAKTLSSPSRCERPLLEPNCPHIDTNSVSYSITATNALEQPLEPDPKSPEMPSGVEPMARSEDGAHDAVGDDDVEDDVLVPLYLRPYAVAPVEWDSEARVKAPFLLRGNLRPYQQAGLEWLASLHTNNLNGILADEMGLGKTIQTIALLAHLACDRGIWGPHLIIVPTSVLLNWEMEFKKFLPGFKVLSYHGNTKRRKELRQGWNNKYHFNVCVTSYTLASRDAHVFKRKPWYYMILDEAHMIKNFKSQRWNILLMFRSFRRLLLTGTPLQNNLTELWALLQFLMSGTNFANLKEFGEWFANPLEKAIEMGTVLDDETQKRVSKLHTVLRPYLLRRLKRDVEKELPSKFEHLILCPLSKRQRYLYDEFMARAETRHDLQSGMYHKIANILMQLRKVVNHPNLFEVRPILTSFAMERSAIADFEIKELLVRRQLLRTDDENTLDLGLLGLKFIDRLNTPLIVAHEIRRLDATPLLMHVLHPPDRSPPYDTRTVDGYRQFQAYKERIAMLARWSHMGYLNHLRCHQYPVLAAETIAIVGRFHKPLLPLSSLRQGSEYMNTVERTHAAVKSYSTRAEEMAGVLDRFAFVTPTVVARDLPRIALSGSQAIVQDKAYDTEFDAVLHRITVKLQIAFPDPSLLQYDCGKLQQLTRLLRERKAGGHRILIFTQMTRILDILEIFLNLHGYLYLRLDGATKIEDRQYITERFNSDPRIFCFISSSRSGGVGINLTGADTVIFYDSDFNPQMDRQCEDRAHRIGQIRDVHIYRFISEHTVEVALLRKANQKRSLDDIVIQKGEFDWRAIFRDEGALTKALGDFEDSEDAHAAAVAASEEVALEGADEADFEWEGGPASQPAEATHEPDESAATQDVTLQEDIAGEDEMPEQNGDEGEDLEEDEEGGTTTDYMLSFIRFDMDFFSDWRL